MARPVIGVLTVVLLVGVAPITASAALVVEKTPSPASLPEPGGTFTYKIKVTNTGPAGVYRIRGITDDVYGDLATRPGSDCSEIIAPGNFSPTPLAATLWPAGTPLETSTAQCTFSGDFTGQAGATLTNTVSVEAYNISTATTGTVTDSATVSITPLATEPDLVIDDDQVTCKNRVATLVGTPGNDALTGTPGPDVIAALDGQDTLRGRGGKDRICGGRGDDELRGGSENDRLNGGAGDDLCRGGSGDNDTAVACQQIVGVP